MKYIKNIKGETLIEVVLGLAILTSVLIGSYILSNQATRITQEANERTEVSNLMRQQAEILKAAEAEYQRIGSNAQWTEVLSRVEDPPVVYGGSCEVTPSGSGNLKVAIPTPGVSGFVLDPANDFLVEDALNTSAIQQGEFFEEGKYTIWMEAYRGDLSAANSLSTPYVDVYITACWERIGGGQIESSGLVVRFAE